MELDVLLVLYMFGCTISILIYGDRDVISTRFVQMQQCDQHSTSLMVLFVPKWALRSLYVILMACLVIMPITLIVGGFDFVLKLLSVLLIQNVYTILIVTSHEYKKYKKKNI